VIESTIAKYATVDNELRSWFKKITNPVFLRNWVCCKKSLQQILF